jgi:alcohol dehydrogenase (NADP+)
MLDFCARHQITADIETLPQRQVNEALERLARNDVRYRFVLDMTTASE